MGCVYGEGIKGSVFVLAIILCSSLILHLCPDPILRTNIFSPENNGTDENKTNAIEKAFLIFHLCFLKENGILRVSLCV